MPPEIRELIAELERERIYQSRRKGKSSFTDQTGIKKRRAVVVSSAAYNLARIDLILMAVTSQLRIPIKADEIEMVDWQKSGLLKPSVIKPVSTTIEKNLILRRLGDLEDEDKENLRLILQTILG